MTSELKIANQVFSCTSLAGYGQGPCNQYWAAVPSDQPNYFWPMPLILRTQSEYMQITDQIPPGLPILGDTYLSIALLDWEFQGKRSTYFTELDLVNASIYFSGRVTNSLGEPLGTYSSFTKINPICDMTKFNAAEQTLSSLLQQINDAAPSDLYSLIYKINTIHFMDGWWPCEALTMSLLKSSTTTVCMQYRIVFAWLIRINNRFKK